MVLVPLGISMSSWSHSIDPKNKKLDKKTFTDDNGANLFQRVGSTSHGKSIKKNIGKVVKSNLVSPVQQILDQTKEKEKRADGPDTIDVSFNMASTSSNIKKTRKSKTPSKKKSTTGGKKNGATIKRLQRKRNAQLKKKSDTGKKSSSKNSSKKSK